MVNYSTLGLRSRSRASPNTWSSVGGRKSGIANFFAKPRADIAAMDLFVAPTIGFDLLYAFVIVRLDRRDLVRLKVTANPTAEWIARQITEASL
jgi:hypothetical protein